MFAGTQYVTLDTAANTPIQHKWNTRRLTFPPQLSFTPLQGTPQQFIAANQVIYTALNTPVCFMTILKSLGMIAASSCLPTFIC